MSGWRKDEDEAIRSGTVPDPAPGLEGYPRVDMQLIEAAVPKLVDHAVGGPVVLTRHGREAYVLLPLDIWRRVWGATSPPPVLDMDPDGLPKR
ncbi:type II toxin-antitoxin system Phd/YefM family antitoxin [Paracraurococcus ruber]|uniref:Antitoxin n=1 Tax=Paracraurococcus ruber TaxID=77675 RepID=A0ABS1CXM3_9PROT|nr:type II toxin-antitoxin system Phd/YefM family antitoxin [Paracraurococcus ruber]MBK1659288.1 hypothetical protein [Paracraurococcus ruber]TDG33032.1 type II toxin-antitoxin system Phd/YefM family antitoxin [Paracraurococcus ruber]